MNKTHDVVVVGNGSLGMMAAIRAAGAHPNWSVVVVGETTRPYSASTAAGAMANVYAEIEALSSEQQKYADKLLALGQISSSKWRVFLEATGGSSVVTAEDTLVVLKKNAYSFEEANFAAMTEVVLEDGVGNLETPNAIEYFAGDRFQMFDSALRINGEFALDSGRLMAHLDHVSKGLGIMHLDSKVSLVNPSDMEVNLVDGRRVQARRIVVAAGAFTQSLFDSEAGLLEMFQGEGLALHVGEMPGGSSRPVEVVRTVNRGGAQCGVHLVPVGDNGLYIGAGNTVAEVGEPNIRFETVSYLLRAAETEFLGRDLGYQLKGSIRLGLRPRSLDGFPMIGPLSQWPEVFIATATNRAGLTWAPGIADFVVAWLDDKDAPEYLEGWNPDRKAFFLGESSALAEHYVESRVGNAVEHQIVEKNLEGIGLARAQFRKVAETYLTNETGKYDPRTVNVDNWASVYAEQAQSKALQPRPESETR